MNKQPNAKDTLPPGNTPEAKTTEPAVAKPQANSDLDTVLNELKRFGGRLTKLEQRNKGSFNTKLPKSEPHFSFEYPEENEQEEEEKLRQEKELIKVERGITRLIRDPKYSEVFEKDKTLARILEANPLALLKEEPLDADDALNQITDVLEETFSNLQPPKTETPEVPKPTPANPSEPETDAPKPAEERPAVKTVEEIGNSLVNRILGRQ